MDIYRQAILDHYKNPRNFGHLEKPDVVIQEGNVTCGDRIVMEIKFKSQNSQPKADRPLDEKDIIAEIKFNGEGCAISQASASMLTEKVRGMKIDDALKFGIADILDMLGTALTPTRVKCATLSLEVLQKGLVMNSVVES